MGYDETYQFGGGIPDDEPIQLRDFSSAPESSTRSASAYTFDNYQDEAGITAVYPESDSGSPAAINYTILGLIGEAGELANKYKKVLRDKEGVADLDDYDAIASEIGDVLWYSARLCEELGIKLSTVANQNISKLNKRNKRNVIRGSGDNR